MIGKDQLAEAVRYNDAISEEGRGLPRLLADLGIDAEGATYVAYQRALRALALVKGGDPEVWGGIAALGGLTAEQQAILSTLAAAFLDGLAAHARAAQTGGRGDE
jgi:hypothetical protein